MRASTVFDPTRLIVSLPKCGAPMWLSRIEPDEPNHDRRTFQCLQCDQSHTEVVKYA
jgi:hypothetical protein